LTFASSIFNCNTATATAMLVKINRKKCHSIGVSHPKLEMIQWSVKHFFCSFVWQFQENVVPLPRKISFAPARFRVV